MSQGAQNPPACTIMNSVERCQYCSELCSRKCEMCNVCSFCSDECEQKAEDLCGARVACAIHMNASRSANNIGEAALHFRMLPYLQTSVTLPWKSSQLRWEALYHGAKHFLHVLPAIGDSRLYKNTAFGMSIILTHDGRLCAGLQRIAYMGLAQNAAITVIRNAADLASKQIEWNEASHPTVELALLDRLPPCERFEDRAILVSGMLSCSAMHFDAILVARCRGTPWTIRQIKPLWAQTLTPNGKDFYKMHYKPIGMVPSATKHSVALVEQALIPRERAPASRPAPAPTASAAWVAPPQPAPAPPQGPPQAPQPAPGPASVPPPRSWSLPQEGFPSLEAARAHAEAQVEAPPWTAQLRAALQE